QRLFARARDWFGVDARIVSTERDHETVGVAPPKRDCDAVSRNEVDAFGHPVGVGFAGDPAGRLDRHLSVEVQPTWSASDAPEQECGRPSLASSPSRARTATRPRTRARP